MTRLLLKTNLKKGNTANNGDNDDNDGVYSLFTWIRCSIESLRYIFFPFLTHSFGLNKIVSFTGILVTFLKFS
jgi:hypothetical protein